MSENTPGKRGPKTVEGKKRVSLNALKHGIHAKSPQAKVAVEAETELSMEKALDIARTTYWPTDHIENALVGRIALCMCRLSRLEAMERRMFERYAARSKPGSDFEALLKSERMVSLEFHRCIKSLAAKRASEFYIAQKAASAKRQPTDEVAARFPWSVRSGNLAEPGPFAAPLPISRDDKSGELKSGKTISFHEETEHEIVPLDAPNTG